MKIGTFNVNSIRSRMEAVFDVLKRHELDALCLQETKAPDEDFPAADITGAGYQVAFRGQKGGAGVAIITREPLKDVRFGLDDSGPADEARIMCARLGSVRIVNTYVPQGRELDNPMFAYKLEWFARLRHLFERRYTPRQAVVWVGDMNVAPAAMDIHNAAQQADHVCYHQSVRDVFAKAVEWGFVDVFRKHHPEPGQYTFFDYRTIDAVKRNMGWRVDHVLATRPLARTSVGCAIDVKPRLQSRPSDHTLVVAEFDV